MYWCPIHEVEFTDECSFCRCAHEWREIEVARNSKTLALFLGDHRMADATVIARCIECGREYIVE